MAEPVSLVLAGWAFGGLIGNGSDRVFCAGVQQVQRTLLAGAKEPANHDLARAARRSQLLALRLAVKAYEKVPHPNWRKFPGYSADDIAAPLTAWTRQGIWNRGKTKLAQPELNAVQAEIDAAFLSPSDAAASAREAKLRRLAEDWTLVEASAQVASKNDWPRFEEIVRSGVDDGTVSYPGFWPLFRAFFAEEVKSDPAVAAILTQQGLATLLNLQRDLVSTVEALMLGSADNGAQLSAALDELRLLLNDKKQTQAALDEALLRIETQALHRIETKIDGLAETLSRMEGVIGRGEWRKLAHHDVLNALIDPGYDFGARPLRLTALLVAKYNVVPYLEAHGALPDLIKWCEAQGDLAGRLYSGRGGVGKTRLLLEATACAPIAAG